MFHRPIALALLYFTLAAMPVVADDDSNLIFSDDFKYRNADEIKTVWQRADKNNPNAAHVEMLWAFEPKVQIGASQKPNHAPVAKLNNGVVYVELDKPVTTSFTLQCQMLMSTYSRTATVAILNAAGTQGYGIRWNSNQPSQFQGQGSIQIVKLDFNEPWNNWDTRAQPLTTPITSGHPIAGYAVTDVDSQKPNNLELASFNRDWQGFADIELTWNYRTHTLAASVNGRQLAEVVDNDFTSFSRIYLRGNTSMFIDELELTVQPNRR